MTTRRTAEQGTDGRPAPRGLMRIPGGVFWTLVALAVLGLVIGYDMRGRSTANAHMAEAQRLEEAGQYEEAVGEYRIALENPRLGNRDRGKIALRVADLTLEHLDNPARAHEYYERSRRYAPTLFSDEAVEGRAAKAREGAAGAAQAPSAQGRVALGHLVPQPPGDADGPVVATFDGEEIRAGEVYRIVGRLPAFSSAVASNDNRELETLITARLEERLAAKAAIEAGIHATPDFAERMHEYQQSLLVQRYLASLKRNADVVTNDEVNAYYEEHRARFNEPERIGLALIKCETSETASLALDALRAGAEFADAATSYSIDTTTRNAGGVAGLVTSGSFEIRGVDDAAAIADGVFALNPGQVSGVTKAGNHFYIFKILTKFPARTVTPDQARAQIESILRATKYDDSTSAIAARLTADYGGRVETGAGATLRAYAEQLRAKSAGDDAPAGEPQNDPGKDGGQ